MTERRGTVGDEGLNCGIVAGSAFGGGSMINWACCLRPPEAIRRQWAEEHGLGQFLEERFNTSVEAACRRLSVTTEVSQNRANELFMDGCRKLGYAVDATGQNMADVGPYPPGAGFIANGCRHGLKQSMQETFLRDAATATRPAQFLDRCHVKRVLHHGGKAVGVQASVVGGDGIEHTLTVRAPIVVVSGGSLNSPALLLRSGLPNRNKEIGKNLHLHPTLPVIGWMPRAQPEVCWWRGAPMTSVHAMPAKDGYGAKLEVPASHLGAIGAFMGWAGPEHIKSWMLDAKRCLPMVVISRDKTAGQVRLAPEGEPTLDYEPDDHLRRTSMDAVLRCVRVLAAAGVEYVAAPQMADRRQLPPPKQAEAREAALEALLAEIERVGFPKGTVKFLSAHQMGSCRMGADPKTSVVGPSCESWECSGLYVMDASVFPTASGVNPMITTCSIAHMASQGLKERLAAEPPVSARPHSRL